MGKRSAGFIVNAGSRTITTDSLAFAASQARAAAISRGVGRVTDVNGDAAAIYHLEDGRFRVEYEPALILFSSSSAQPFWISRLVTLLDEQG